METEFAGQHLMANEEDPDILRCSACSVTVNHHKIDTIRKHVNSDKHRAHLQQLKAGIAVQQSIKATLVRAGVQNAQQEVYRSEVVGVFLRAGMPLLVFFSLRGRLT